MEATTEATTEVTTEVTGQVTGQVTVKVLEYCQTHRSGKQIQALVGIRHRETFLENTLNPLLATGWLALTIPEKPQSRLQK